MFFYAQFLSASLSLHVSHRGYLSVRIVLGSLTVKHFMESKKKVYIVILVFELFHELAGSRDECCQADS
jgi:hypothetical protein